MHLNSNFVSIPTLEGKSSPPQFKKRNGFVIIKETKQPACQWVEIPLFSGNPQWGGMVRLDIGHCFKTRLFSTIETHSKQLNQSKHNYILGTTKLGSLSRVFFNGGVARVCFLRVLRDQPCKWLTSLACSAVQPRILCPWKQATIGGSC